MTRRAERAAAGIKHRALVLEALWPFHTLTRAEQLVRVRNLASMGYDDQQLASVTRWSIEQIRRSLARPGSTCTATVD